MRFSTLCAPLAALTLALPVAAQSPTPPDATPSAAYNNILTPFTQTREDMRNWSQIEIDAFSRATTEAAAACQRLEQTPHEGEELFTLARLCALGLNWSGAYSAASRYTYATPAPHLIDAYTILFQADLNTNNADEIPQRLQQLLANSPLTPDIRQLILQMIDLTQFTSPTVATNIALLLEPLLLHALNTADPAISPTILQSDAWTILILLHRNHRTADEQAFQAKLTTALAALPTPAPAIPQQRWYTLLGHPLSPTLRVLLPHNPAPTRELLLVTGAPLQENSSLYRSLQTLQAQRPIAQRLSLLVVGSPIPHTLHLRSTTLASTNDPTARTLSNPQGPTFIELTPTHDILSITQGDPAWLDSTPLLNALLPATP